MAYFKQTGTLEVSTEGQMWTYMRPRLAPYGRWVRVENPAGPGTPDVYYRVGGHNGFAGWLELKHMDEPPVNPSTAIWHPELTLDQVMWLEEEAGLGGRAHLLLRCGRAYILMGVVTVRKFYERKLRYDTLRREALYHSQELFSPAELVKCLRGK